MIKPWKDRVEEAAHFREEDYINDVQYFMQAEIDELRQENARLKSALLTNDTTIESANNAAGMLEAENAKLRDALEACLSSLQYAWGCIENSTEQEDAKIEIGLDAARAALGES